MSSVAPPPRQAPVALPEASPVNRVGLAPDAMGRPMICFAGAKKQWDLLASLPGAHHWPEYGCLAYPLSRINLLVTETIARIEIATPEYLAVRGRCLSPHAHYAAVYPAAPPGEPPPLRHQIDAFCGALQGFAQGFRGFGQWSEQGSGKSRWACDLIRVLVQRSAVLVIQNSTALQWEDWLRRLCLDFEVVMLTGIPLADRAARLCDGIGRERCLFVVNWEVIARLEAELIGLRPELVLADEATRAKERNSQMSKALARIGRAATYRVAMTGTPLGNSPADLWAIYRFLEPGLFERSFWAYMRRYFRLGGWSGNEFTGFEPAQVGPFIERMYACSYRITKSAIQDMPPVSFETVRLAMPPEQERVYRAIETDLYARLQTEDGGEASLTVASTLAQCVRLQQITAGLFPAGGTPGERAECLPIPSAKTEWLREYCRETLATSDVQLVIWCRFTDEIAAVCRALAETGARAGETFAVIDGGVKNRDRRDRQVRFNDREDPLRVLVCQLQAVAMGFDLPAADCMLYHSASFSYLERAQSLERGHRLGRTRPYIVIDLVCRNTIDVRILQCLKQKQDLAELLLTAGFRPDSF